MAFPKFKVDVNYDGRHHLEARQRESDIRRDESIAAVGWQSVTVTAGHVRTWGFDGCAPASWMPWSVRAGGSKGDISALSPVLALRPRHSMGWVGRES